MRWIFDRWSKSRSFTPSELLALQSLLPQDMEDANLLYAQAINAPCVIRKRAENNGYVASIPYLEDSSLLISCRRNCNSPQITAIESVTNKEIVLSTEILRGGFLLGLKGCMADGEPVPRWWSSVPSSFTIPPAIKEWLLGVTESVNQEEVLATLLQWTGQEQSELHQVVKCNIRLWSAASKSDVEMCESRLNITIGEQYRQFLGITNGIDINYGRTYSIFGTDDIDFVGEDGRWIGITPLYEEGVVAMRNEKGVVSELCYHISPDGKESCLGDFRKHVQDSLRWESGQSHVET